MANGQIGIQFDQNEDARAIKFGKVWSSELNPAFEDIARYYDKANHVASLGMWNWFQRRFLETIDVRPKQTVLDVCAGTNAVESSREQGEAWVDACAEAIAREARWLVDNYPGLPERHRHVR